MPETKRLFIAAPIPELLKAVFWETLPAFTNPAVRVLPEENLHLTIHFLGEVPVADIPPIYKGLQQAANTNQPFTLQLDCLEPGPKPKSPRLVWARFRPAAAFAQICKAVFEQLGIRPPDQEDYIPHITLARFRKDLAKPRQLPRIEFKGQAILLPVSSVALWQSELRSPHPAYSVLAEFPLGINKN